MSPYFSKPEEAGYHMESIRGRGVGKGEKARGQFLVSPTGGVQF